MTRPSPIVSKREGLGGLADIHPLLKGSDDDAADDVDEHDHDAGDGVPADELAGTVHGSVEIGFARDLLAALAGLLLR